MVFSLTHLHRLRERELKDIVGEMPAGAAVLEIGAGTGGQSKMLSELGFKMTAVDLAQSNYNAHRVFPVADYDGKTLPVPAGTIDVVFSSNVLEHVSDLTTMHGEIGRVLKPSGFCLHVIPSTSWRLWTTVSGWLDIVPAVRDWYGRSNAAAEGTLLSGVRDVLKIVAQRAIPRRHGEHGSALTELWTFSRKHWVEHFKAHGFSVEFARPMGLFYTGYMVLGSNLGTERRQHLAPLLGSACNLYKVRPLSE